MTVGRLWSVTLDCDDPVKVRDFWAAMLGGKVAHTSENFVGVELASGMWIGAVRSPGHKPAEWPEGDTPQQFHLDLAVDDLDEAEKAALDLGAAKADHQPDPDKWRVLLDPAGHPFCVTNQAPA
jgi:catechol 2,3-dioxygenase-like lactoylglutathione lyase family enzyme